MKRMNILIITPEYPPRTIGGGGVVYQNIARELKHHGYMVSVIAGNFRNKSVTGEIESFDDNGVPVHFIPLLPLPNVKEFDIDTYTLPTIPAAVFLAKELLRTKTAVIHLHGLCHPIVDMTAFACMFMRKKYVLTCHGIAKSPETAGRLWKGLFDIYMATIARLVIRKAGHITIVSRSLMTECLNKNLINGNMTVVPNGINRALAEPDSNAIDMVDKKYSLRDKKVAFAIGRMSPTKGFQHLIVAMQKVALKLPDAVAVIAGTGTYWNKLQALVDQKRLAGRVMLIGHVNEEEKAALYKRSDVVVFPSLREPFGLVILEAFAMHKPVVAFNTESALEIISDQRDGLIAPLANENGLAEAMLRVLTDHALRQRLVENTNAKVEEYRWEKIIEKYIKVYHETYSS